MSDLTNYGGAPFVALWCPRCSLTALCQNIFCEALEDSRYLHREGQSVSLIAVRCRCSSTALLASHSHWSASFLSSSVHLRTFNSWFFGNTRLSNDMSFVVAVRSCGFKPMLIGPLFMEDYWVSIFAEETLLLLWRSKPINANAGRNEDCCR